MCQKTYNGKKIASSANGASRTAYLLIKEWTRVYTSHPSQKPTQGLLETLIERPDTLKLLEEHTGKHFKISAQQGLFEDTNNTGDNGTSGQVALHGAKMFLHSKGNNSGSRETATE